MIVIINAINHDQWQERLMAEYLPDILVTSITCWQFTAGTTVGWWWIVDTCQQTTNFSSHRRRSRTISQTSRRGITAANYCPCFTRTWPTPGV